MSEVVHRRNPLFTFPLELRDFFGPFPALTGLASGVVAPQTIRVEAHFEPDAYVLRAELPGVDPERDVDVTVTGDVLRVRAERIEEKTEKHHSEFRYGSFARTLPLPADAKAKEVTASYDAGILTIRVPLSKPAAAEAHTVNVTSAAKKK